MEKLALLQPIQTVQITAVATQAAGYLLHCPTLLSRGRRDDKKQRQAK
jgi:hypothetical protein